MKASSSFRRRKHSESGQVMLFVLLGLGTFLIGAMAFAIDLSNLWFQRQSAQTAADAACTAGAMDLLVDATNGTTNQGLFTAGTAFDCNTNGTYSPCAYANLNGFSSSLNQGDANAGNLGNNVYVDFPTTIPGVVTPASTLAPNPFMRVTVTNNIPTFFAGMLRGTTTQRVGAISLCGVAQSTAPIPIVVLDPQNPNAGGNPSALDVQGNPTISIIGGPSRSIQVNSTSTTAVNIGGTGLIDLSQGGPSTTVGAPGTGSDLGAFGGPNATPTIPKNFNPGTTGHWISPAAPIGDPFAQVCAPGQSGCPLINGNSPPGTPTAPLVPTDEKAPAQGGKFSASPCTSIPCNIGWQDHGCPETSATRGSGKCLLYTAGIYPSGISASGGSGGAGSAGITLLFDPGVYYITGGLNLGSGSTIRPGTGAGDGSGGVVFYFSGTGTISVDSNSGSKPKDPFNTVTGPHTATGVAYPVDDPLHTNTTYGNGVKCTAGSSLPNNLRNGGAGVDIGKDASGNAVGANILLAPCTGYYGDPLGAADPLGVQRGFVFFQDHSARDVNPSWGGGGQFLLAGTMYFHSCNASGTGTACGTAPTYYNDIFTMQGNSGSNTYVLGQIVADNLALGGTSGITMDLNPNVAFSLLKASLFQ
jgi:Flp pilus assembly protein TadG